MSVVLRVKPGGPALVGKGRIGDDVVEGFQRRTFGEFWIGQGIALLDLGSGAVLGDIPNTPGVHGIAIAPELNRGFASNGRDSSVTMFDLRTFAVRAYPVERVPELRPGMSVYTDWRARR